MPFKKIGKDKYRSPSGKLWSLSQIRAYQADKKRNKQRLARLRRKK